MTRSVVNLDCDSNVAFVVDLDFIAIGEARILLVDVLLFRTLPGMIFHFALLYVDTIHLALG